MAQHDNDDETATIGLLYQAALYGRLLGEQYPTAAARAAAGIAEEGADLLDRLAAHLEDGLSGGETLLDAGRMAVADGLGVELARWASHGAPRAGAMASAGVGEVCAALERRPTLAAKLPNLGSLDRPRRGTKRTGRA